MKTLPVLWFLPAIMAISSARAFSQVAGALQPVLVTFDASLGTDHQVFFTWTVQQQFVTAIFNIEKSTDGLHWVSISSINSTGVSSKPVTYHAVDKMPVRGTNLYRLRIGSMDGSSIYTVVKNVRVDAPVAIRLYPNPSVSVVTVSLAQSPEKSYWTLSLINHAGQVIIQQQYHASETKICLPVGNYPNGQYTVQISDGSSKHHTALMINHQ